MATATTASRLLPKIVHPASQLSREDHGKITVEARKLTSATGSRGRPHSCPEMSVEHLLGSSRLTSGRLRHMRACSARQQRSQSVTGGGHRLPQFSSTEEVCFYTYCSCTCIGLLTTCVINQLATEMYAYIISLIKFYYIIIVIFSFAIPCNAV